MLTLVRNTPEVYQSEATEATKPKHSYIYEAGTDWKTKWRFAKTKNKYSRRNNVFNADTLTAYSFRWWQYVAEINGKIVFNNYSYSSSTGRHQNDMKQLLDSLGIKIDLTIEAPNGLQRLDSAIDYYTYKIMCLIGQCAKSGTRRTTNYERLAEMERLLSKLIDVYKLQKRRHKRAVNTIRKSIDRMKTVNGL